MTNKIEEQWPVVEETTEVAEKAAEWWTAFLRDPDDVEFDNGDPMFGALAKACQDDSGYHPDDLDAFQEQLAKRIQGHVDNTNGWGTDNPHYSVFMKCDYHSDPVLVAAGRDVGLELDGMTVFPSKTSMKIHSTHIFVRGGYSTERELIWEVGDYYDQVKGVCDERDFKTRVVPLVGGYEIKVYRENEDVIGMEDDTFSVMFDEQDSWDVIKETLEGGLNIAENWAHDT